jgi:hypothetical protein
MKKLLAFCLAVLMSLPTAALGGTISRPTKTFGGTSFVNGVVPDASDFNGDIDTIYSEFNGNITNVNIDASAAIAGSKISPAFTSQVSVTGGTPLLFEGATADDFELSIAVTDPTADITLTLPDDTGTVITSTLSTNEQEVANSIWGASNGLVFEGATADGFETTITPTDPTADRTVTLPNDDGTIIFADNTNTWSAAQTFTADATFNDNVNVTFGTGGDADIDYDGTDLIIAPAVVGAGDLVVSGASIEFDDSEGTTFGTGKDATIQYDGTHMVVNPDAVGSGS